MSGPDDRKILKRFANLDIDGVTRPPKPAPKREPARPEARRPSASPQRNSASAPERRPALSEERPMPAPPRAAPQQAPPRPPARGGMMTVEAVRLDVGGGGRAEVIEIPPGATPGVLTVEFTPAPRRAAVAEPAPAWPPTPVAPVRRAPVPDGPELDALPRRYAPPEAAPRRTVQAGSAWSAPQAEAPPITLTELAARQIRLMAWQHGVPGAGLRILTSGPGGPEHCDFAFESEPEEGDVVFLSQGVRIFVDRASLRTLRGLRVTYQDLPGASGFGLS